MNEIEGFTAKGGNSVFVLLGNLKKCLLLFKFLISVKNIYSTQALVHKHAYILLERMCKNTYSKYFCIAVH